MNSQLLAIDLRW